MLRKSIPLIFAISIGLVAGLALANAIPLKQWYFALPALPRVPLTQAPSTKAIEHTPQALPDLKDAIRQLLKDKDVQSVIQSLLTDPKIDIKAVSELVARYVAESPEIRRALADQLRSQETRKLLTDALRSPEFRQAIKEIVSSRDFKDMYKEIVVQVMKNQPETATQKPR